MEQVMLQYIVLCDGRGISSFFQCDKAVGADPFCGFYVARE